MRAPTRYPGPPELPVSGFHGDGQTTRKDPRYTDPENPVRAHFGAVRARNPEAAYGFGEFGGTGGGAGRHGKQSTDTDREQDRHREPHTLEPDPMTTTATTTQPPRVPIADLRARLKILYAGPECWSVRWDEPLAPADPRQWSDYLHHAEAVLVPLLRQNFPAWQASRRTPRPVTIRATVYGVVRSIPEATVRDFIRVFLLAFPAAVLAGHRLKRFSDLAPIA